MSLASHEPRSGPLSIQLTAGSDIVVTKAAVITTAFSGMSVWGVQDGAHTGGGPTVRILCPSDIDHAFIISGCAQGATYRRSRRAERAVFNLCQAGHCGRGSM